MSFVNETIGFAKQLGAEALDIWQIREFRIFFTIILLAIVLYIALLVIIPFVKRFFMREKEVIGKGLKKKKHYRLIDERKANKKAKQKSNKKKVEVGTERVVWYEYPLVELVIPQKIFERSMYGVVIGVLFILVILRFVFW